MEYKRLFYLGNMISKLRRFCPEAFTQQLIKRPKSLSEEYEIYRVLEPIRIPKYRSEELYPLFKEPLTPKEIEEIDREIEKLGIEALAWYHLFHHLPIESWGIYITLKGLKYLTSKIGYTKHPFFAFEILWQHEVFHFLVESFALRTEFLMLQPRYLPYEMKTKLWQILRFLGV